MRMVALVPARAGSKRIPGKNTRQLAGQPLIAWTIQAARESGVFDRVLVCSDDDYVFDLTLRCGGPSYMCRPPVPDAQPDIEWVREALATLVKADGGHPDAFAILRPTSPFRTAATIRRAFTQFSHDESHSLRAVQPVKEHPYKMWTCAGPGYPMVPLLDLVPPGGTPLHSMPTQELSRVYVQNASLEMAWSYVVQAFGTISGRKVSPFFTEGYEGYDINDESDWAGAERLIAEGKVALQSLARV